MPQTGYCTDLTCHKELTELYECHCCNWLICLKHLLEHVEISKRDKKKQFDSLRNDLISVSYTLEFIVEKKIQEIEREKKLINQVKIILEKSDYSIEEMREICEEINQAIVSNRKEETIVKVESSLSDIRTCSCSNEISDDKIKEELDISDLSSSSYNILQQPNSPVYRSLRVRPNGSEKSTTPKNNDLSTKVDSETSNMITDDETFDSLKDETDDVSYNHENTPFHKSLCEQCPLTFDGAFGLTKAKHSIELCSIGNSRRRNLLCHFQQKHKLKRTHAHRLYQAIRYGQDPQTIKLFSENEVVINHDHHIPCPFSSGMINLIGCCPTQSRKIPCQSKSVVGLHLALHLRQYHHLSTAMAKTISQNYKEKLSKMRSSNNNDTICLNHE